MFFIEKVQIGSGCVSPESKSANIVAPVDTAHLAFIKNVKMSKLLESYWSNLWFAAKPLNEGKRINWDELKAISQRVGMSIEEFDAMTSKWKDEIQRRKRRK